VRRRSIGEELSDTGRWKGERGEGKRSKKEKSRYGSKQEGTEVDGGTADKYLNVTIQRLSTWDEDGKRGEKGGPKRMRKDGENDWGRAVEFVGRRKPLIDEI